MAHLELTDEEIDELQSTLGSYLSDLRMEIAGTDNWEFRQALKRREMLLDRVLERLGQRGA